MKSGNQLSTREQCIDMLGEECTKRWEDLLSDMKVPLAGMSKVDCSKPTYLIKSFNVGSGSNTPQKHFKSYQIWTFLTTMYSLHQVVICFFE